MMAGMKVVGGPFDGQEVGWTSDVVVFDDLEYGMAYHRTRPTGTNWRETYDHDWFIHGQSAPPAVPDRVYEWHERDWQSPEVTLIKAALTEAADRFR